MIQGVLLPQLNVRQPKTEVCSILLIEKNADKFTTSCLIYHASERQAREERGACFRMTLWCQVSFWGCVAGLCQEKNYVTCRQKMMLLIHRLGFGSLHWRGHCQVSVAKMTPWQGWFVVKQPCQVWKENFTKAVCSEEHSCRCIMLHFMERPNYTSFLEK